MPAPRPKPGCDIKSLPLKPSEAFLLSRIDGVVSERELATLSGLPPADVAAALEKLRALGAIEIERADAGPAAAPPGPGAAAAAKPPPAPAAPAGRDALHGTDSPPLYDPAELDEPVDLAVEKKRRILDLYYRLEDMTHYQLLGAPEHAEKKQIKAAYYALAPEFHPDAHFRKQLGSYKGKIEAIFNRITLAHDVLTSKQKRVEYDAYVEQMHRNRAMAALIEQTARDIDSVVSAVDATARAMVGEDGEPASSPGRYSSEPRGGPPPATAPAKPAAPAGAVARPPAASAPAMPAVTAQERRAAFARKLVGGGRRTPPAGAPAPEAGGGEPGAGPPPDRSSSPGGPASAGPASRPAESVRAAETLKARYDAARAEARRVQLERYAVIGRAALERKDFASAANAYRIAASLAPDDAEIQRTCAEVQQLAAAALADGYLKQAQYEAQHERWVEAALSFAKVCNGRPDDARAHDRVAYATLKAGGNTRRAVEFARRAVELAPESAEFRLTLALAYAAAGLAKSASGEIDRAAELSQNDARMRELVAQVREQTKKNGRQG